MMDGFSAYKYYMALKLHFGSVKYNVFESRGAVKCSRDRFNDRRDHYMFDKLAKKFGTDKDLIQFMASNFIYNNPNFIYSGSEAEENYLEWQRRKQSATKLFADDCDKIISLNMSLKEIFYCTNNAIQYIISLGVSNSVNIETIRILDDQLDFISKIKPGDPVMTMFNEYILRINKSKGFVKYDADKVKPVFDNLIEELRLKENGTHV